MTGKALHVCTYVGAGLRIGEQLLLVVAFAPPRSAIMTSLDRVGARQRFYATHLKRLTFMHSHTSVLLFSFFSFIASPANRP